MALGPSLYGARRSSRYVIRDAHGRVWHQQMPGDLNPRSWRDLKWIAGDYELEWRKSSPGDTPDTGWYLYGAGIFGQYMARHLYEAIFEAAKTITRRMGA